MKIRAPAALAFGLLAVAAPIGAQVTVAPLTEPLGVSGPVTPVKSGRAVYIVKLRDAGAATYKGDSPASPLRSPARASAWTAAPAP